MSKQVEVGCGSGLAMRGARSRASTNQGIKKSAPTVSSVIEELLGPICEAARHVKQHYGPRSRIVKHFNTNKIDGGSVF